MFLFLPQLFPQELLIRGKVIDKTTNQILKSVSVHDKTSFRGTVTDDSGSFKISLPAGQHNIEFSYTGFERVDTTINLFENIEISIYLNPFTVSVGEVTITADGLKDHVSSPLMGSFTLTNKEMMKLPSLLGETDPLKLLQLTPGVQAGSEGGIGFYVRGGGTDQNLILYDNTIIYNPGHLLGFFSVFNPEIIKDVSIIKSGIPAQYGGKISSVIKLNSYKGNRDSVEVMGSMGIISSRISIDGPLFKGKGTFILGARRTYLELFVEPIVRLGAKSTSFINKQNNYNFYDFNTGASLKITNVDFFSFSAYHGRDKYRMGQAGIKQENSLEWGNSMASLLWNHKISEKGELNTNISWTRYEFDLSGSQSDYSYGLFSSVMDYSLKSDLSIEKNRMKITTGLELTNHSFIPNRINAQAGNLILDFGQFSAMKALEGAIFFDDELPVTSRLSIAGGFRFSFFNHHGPYSKFVKNMLGQITDTLFYPRGKSLAFFANPEPRLVLKYQINDNTSLKASYMRIAQYIHLATSATASLPTDSWIPSTSKLKPLVGDQLSMGYFRNFPKKGLEFSTEIYYKKMNNQLEFLRGVINTSIVGNMEDNLAIGNGQSYGVELYLRKKIGNSTGWLSYTLSRTEQKFDEINAGFVYPAKYDRRHDISLTLIRTFNEKWSGSAVFIYISGNAFTMPVGRYIIQGNIVNQYGDVNSFRMPPYHRMDVSMTRKIITRKNWSSELIFSIYNIYNRANPYFIYFEAAGDLEKYSLEIKAVEVSLFPLIPSVSWSFKF
ncbi:MAG: TonB-dependent receptor [Bacteroidia bacterium]|nr:TonB-dependent receptor [Bacteroidia bacterium]